MMGQGKRSLYAPVDGDTNAGCLDKVDQYLPLANVVFPWTLVPFYAHESGTQDWAYFLIFGAYHNAQLTIAFKVWAACKVPKTWRIAELMSLQHADGQEIAAMKLEMSLIDLILSSFTLMLGWLGYLLFLSDIRLWPTRFSVDEIGISLYVLGVCLYAFTVGHDIFTRRQLRRKLAAISTRIEPV